MANFKSNSFTNLFKLKGRNGNKKRTIHDVNEDSESVHSSNEPVEATPDERSNSKNGSILNTHGITSLIDLHSLITNGDKSKKKRKNSLHRKALDNNRKKAGLMTNKKRKLNNGEAVEDEDDSEYDTDDINITDYSAESSESEVESEEDEETKKLKEIEHQKFLEQEKKYDEMLPEKYRKYRPQGYKFNLPDEDSDKPIRVYADGIFDLFHIGHMKQLEQCKKAFKNVTLVVGVPSDKVTHKLKGLTVLTDEQRCDSLRHCKWVDEVIPNSPMGVDDVYKPVKELGKFLVTQRTDGISTSDIITTIIRDYDKYLMRNFSRGATRQELNVSWLKQNELNAKQFITKLASKYKRAKRNLKKGTKFEELSTDFEEEEEEATNSDDHDSEHSEDKNQEEAKESSEESVTGGPEEFVKEFA
ncbi:unnamed protein product [Hanseniaspora opuntiae]